MRMLRTRGLSALGAACSVVLLAACAGNAGVDDLCAAADMPANTPAEVQVLKARVDGVFQKGKAFTGSEHNKRVFKAAMSVSQSAEHAQFLASVSASEQAALASDLFKDFGKGNGFTLTDLPKAQAELRAACRG